MDTIASELAASIRSIPDYPKPGIIFRDITTMLGNAKAFRRAVDALVLWMDKGINAAMNKFNAEDRAAP